MRAFGSFRVRNLCRKFANFCVHPMPQLPWNMQFYWGLSCWHASPELWRSANGPLAAIPHRPNRLEMQSRAAVDRVFLGISNILADDVRGRSAQHPIFSSLPGISLT